MNPGEVQAVPTSEEPAPKRRRKGAEDAGKEVSADSSVKPRQSKKTAAKPVAEPSEKKKERTRRVVAASSDAASEAPVKSKKKRSTDAEVVLSNLDSGDGPATEEPKRTRAAKAKAGKTPKSAVDQSPTTTKRSRKPKASAATAPADESAPLATVTKTRRVGRSRKAEPAAVEHAEDGSETALPVCSPGEGLADPTEAAWTHPVPEQTGLVEFGELPDRCSEAESAVEPWAAANVEELSSQTTHEEVAETAVISTLSENDADPVVPLVEKEFVEELVPAHEPVVAEPVASALPAPPASVRQGVSEAALNRALQTWSKAPDRNDDRAQALKNQEAARRYAEAKIAALRRAGKLPEAKPTAPASAPARVGTLTISVPPSLTTLTRRAKGGWTLARAGMAGAIMLSLLVGLFGLARHRAGQRAEAGLVGRRPAWWLSSSEEWLQQARQRAREGDFRLALGAVKYALASSPGNPELHAFAGDMHQSLFEFTAAQRDYEQALRLDTDNGAARQNLMLCRRINRYGEDAALHRSTIYGLHRVMLGQHRISEAVAISQRMRLDRAARQATWQAALEAAGFKGKVTVGDGGEMALDLAGTSPPDLARLRDFPVTDLNLADTGVEDVSALWGMPLKRLNLARTLVHDLAPLGNLPLQSLDLRGTGVVEISALVHCPLGELDITDTRVGELSPLAAMPLRILRAANTPVADLRPLAALPLTTLDLAATRVHDLQPLGNLGLQVLSLAQTRVTDLSALRGCQLRELDLSATAVSSLVPLAGMPLTILGLTGCAGVTDLRPLVSCPELEHLRLPPHPQFIEKLAGLPRLRFIEPGQADQKNVLLTYRHDGKAPPVR